MLQARCLMLNGILVRVISYMFILIKVTSTMFDVKWNTCKGYLIYVHIN